MTTTHEITEHEPVLVVPPSDHAPRVHSGDPSDFPVPHGREEEWRFTPMRVFERLLAGEPATATLEVTTRAPEGVLVSRVSLDDPALASLPLPVDRLGALAVAGGKDALVVAVPSGIEVTEAVLVGLRGPDAAAVAHGLVVLDLGAHARATVVIEHTGSAQYAGQVAVQLAEGASLDLVQVQAWDHDAVHGAHVAIRVGRDARVRSTQVSLGGRAVRVLETVEYTGPGGDAELTGLFFADAGQHLEHRLFVDHSQPHCRSNVLYKGALQGEGAHTVWVGDVLIRAAAVGTSTYEINRNLVLTDGARADSVPNLEIETGEVSGAGHASTTGRFDDEQLFYLQSRGIPTAEARRLVVYGFFAELLARITVPEVRSRLLAAVESELGGGDERFRFDDQEES